MLDFLSSVGSLHADPRFLDVLVETLVGKVPLCL